MGQIQNAVGSVVGNAAIGAIAKQSINKIKQELGTTKEVLKSTQEDANLTNEMIAEGKDPLTGMSLEEAAKLQKENPESYADSANIPFDESKAAMSAPFNELKATGENKFVGKQSQFKKSQMTAVRNKIQGGKR